MQRTWASELDRSVSKPQAPSSAGFINLYFSSLNLFPQQQKENNITYSTKLLIK